MSFNYLYVSGLYDNEDETVERLATTPVPSTSSSTHKKNERSLVADVDEDIMNMLAGDTSSGLSDTKNVTLTANTSSSTGSSGFDSSVTGNPNSTSGRTSPVPAASINAINSRQPPRRRYVVSLASNCNRIQLYLFKHFMILI